MGFYGKFIEIPALDDDVVIDDFTETIVTTELFNLKLEKLTTQTGNNGIKNVEMIVPLKYLSNLWITLEMILINCEITLDLN